MGILRKICAAMLALLFLLFTMPSMAEIIPMKLRSDNRHLIPIMDFEFSSAGYVSFALSSVSLNSTSSSSSQSPPDPSLIGFFFVMPNHLEAEFQRTTICASDFRLLLFNLSNYDANSLFNKSYPVEFPGRHSLFFVNCNNQSIVSMEARIDLYNTFLNHANRTTKDYLSASLTHHPKFFSITSIIYLCLLGIWSIMLLMHHRSFHKMHLLMGGLLLISSLHAHFASEGLYYVKFNGASPPHALQVLLYVFQFVRTEFFFTVIVLIGVGWGLWKPCLGTKEKVVLMVVILLQVWGNVDSILAGVHHYDTDRRLYLSVDCRVIDLVCWFVLFFPVMFSFILLKEEEEKETSETDGNSLRKADKLCLFVMMMVLPYLVITRFIDFAAVVAPELSGHRIYVTESSILVLCMVAFYTFRPFHEGENGKTVEISKDDKSGVSSIV